METRRRVLKVDVAEDRVLLKSKETRAKEIADQAERILVEAREAAERIRKGALEAAERERRGARETASALLQKAEEEKEEAIVAACTAAREEARKECLSELRPRIEEGVARFERLVRAAERTWSGCFEAHRNEVVALATGIAEKVVQRVAAEDRELVQRTAEAALVLAQKRQEVTLRVHPDDLAILEEFGAELVSRFDDIRTFRLEEDRRVDRGGVWIETPSGFVDARIGAQLNEIIQSILPDSENPWVSEPEDCRKSSFPVEEAGPNNQDEEAAEESL